MHDYDKRQNHGALFHTCNDDLGQGLDTSKTHAVKDLTNAEVQERLGRTFDDQAHEVRGESIGQRSGTAKDVCDFGVEGHQSGREHSQNGGQDGRERGHSEETGDVTANALGQTCLERDAQGLDENTMFV